MHLTPDQLAMLRRYGFKWYKNHCTDAVNSYVIRDIVPAANGFTVLYTEEAALIASTVVVNDITFPSNPYQTWILVHWERIEDEQRAEVSCT